MKISYNIYIYILLSPRNKKLQTTWNKYRISIAEIIENAICKKWRKGNVFFIIVYKCSQLVSFISYFNNKERKNCELENNGWKILLTLVSAKMFGLGKIDAHQVEKTVAINQILPEWSPRCQIAFIRHGYKPKFMLQVNTDFFWNILHTAGT